MPLSFRSLAIASVSIALLAATAGYFFAGHAAAPTASPASQSAKAVQVRSLNQQFSQHSRAQLPNPGALPVPLQGASHGVVLQADGNGQLRLQPELLQLFDFYFSAIDEEPVAQILLRIHHDLASQLHEPALAQARDLLKRYLDYRLAMADLPAGNAAPSANVPASAAAVKIATRAPADR